MKSENTLVNCLRDIAVRYYFKLNARKEEERGPQLVPGSLGMEDRWMDSPQNKESWKEEKMEKRKQKNK